MIENIENRYPSYLSDFGEPIGFSPISPLRPDREFIYDENDYVIGTRPIEPEPSKIKMPVFGNSGEPGTISDVASSECRHDSPGDLTARNWGL